MMMVSFCEMAVEILKTLRLVGVGMQNVRQPLNG
jgi:hypothetical protein